MLKKAVTVIVVIAALGGLYVAQARVRAEIAALRAERQFARDAAAYLFAPSGVKNKDGKDISRAQLLDAALAEMVKAPAPPISAPVK